MISTYSYNAEREKDPQLAKRYFEKGLKSLRVLNYRDALMYFARAYSIDPKSYYGELSYLYLGKSYSLYSFAFGSKRGILAAIGYLNQYPFHYKVPRFIYTQREFIADSYLILQWYETAKNIYANLYGETERKEYMIKYSYASSLSGSIEGYNYLRELDERSVPADYLDLYYATLGFYNFNIGRYALTIHYLTQAININTYLREDANLLFRMGVSHFKLGNWRKAPLYLELALRSDPFKIYEEKANFYLAIINLETKNFREAYENLRKLTEKGRLFYSKLAQILFSSLWYYDEFLKVYSDRIGNYREKLLKIGWLNVEDVYGEFPALGIYFLSLKEKRITEEEKDFLRIKELSLREFVFENDLFSFEKYVERVRGAMKNLRFYVEDDALLLSDLYKTNRKNFLRIFRDQESIVKLSRSLVFLGDDEAEKILPLLKDRALLKFLYAKLMIVKGEFRQALKLINESLPKLSDEDRLEAELLVGYLKNDQALLEKVVRRIDFKNPRFSYYRIPFLIKLADLYYSRGEFKKAMHLYREVVREGEGSFYWWAMFRIALISERLKDSQTLKWVVKRAKEEDNIWSKVIRILWEG